MWDFHTHILPGIDDGAENFDEAISMIEELRGLGFEGVVATPHANPMYIPDRKRLKDLRDDLQGRTGFPILIGYETAMDVLLIEDPTYFAIEGTNMILVELPWFDESFDYRGLLMGLLKRGLRPILAHPERHSHIDMGALEDIKSMGVLIQVNVKSILGAYGESVRRKALQFFPLSDIVGSDAHSPEDYSLFVSKGVEYYEGRHFGEYKGKEL